MYKITKQSLSLLLRKIQLPLHKGALKRSIYVGFQKEKTASCGTLRKEVCHSYIRLTASGIAPQ